MSKKINKILFVGFGLSAPRKEAVSINAIEFSKHLKNKAISSSIYNIGYSTRSRKDSFLEMVLSVFNIFAIQADIIKTVKRRKITHIYDTFVLPGASLIFIARLKRLLPSVTFIKELQNDVGFSHKFSLETLIRFFLNAKWQVKIIFKIYDKVIARNLHIAKTYRATYIPPLVKILKLKRDRKNTSFLKICFLGHSLPKKGINEFGYLFKILPDDLKTKISFNLALNNIGHRAKVKRKLFDIAKINKINVSFFENVNPQSFFRNQDILFLPLEDEFSSAASLNTVLEAMEAGCMVVTTSTKVSKAIVTDKENGILLLKPTAKVILKIIKEIFLKRINISIIKRKARAYIVKNYSKNLVYDLLKQIYV
ncbi:MAG TPA: glycosyltransferase [Patescibacteria group bacterium]|nr:glycosyltransferase [Patescibacteria group bacterium]